MISAALVDIVGALCALAFLFLIFRG